MSDVDDDPIIELYKRDVDVSLIRENLKKTVEQRIQRLEEFVQFAAQARKAVRQSQTK